jgi:hypothetical protein
MSYYIPRDNVFIEGILYIPKEQQYNEYFSYTHGNTSVVDNPKDIKKMNIPDLKKLAKSIGILPIPKGKQELVLFLQSKIVFE